MLPCMKAIHDRTGLKPVIIVSREYQDVLDGVSYVKAYPIAEHWWKGVPKARQIAEMTFGNAIVPRWWHDDEKHIQMIHDSSQGNFVIQCHGDSWGVPISKWPDYGTSMAERCGFSRDEWIKLPLVFDRRNKDREKKLVDHLLVNEKRPVILYNFNGVSSPFGYSGEIQRAIRNTFTRAFRFLDLGTVRAFRIYDLLGLYDRAVGLLTSDTATMHLAPASKVPYIGFTVDSWSTSVPKGNCALHVKYSQTVARMKNIIDTIATWRTQ